MSSPPGSANTIVPATYARWLPGRYSGPTVTGVCQSERPSASEYTAISVTTIVPAGSCSARPASTITTEPSTETPSTSGSAGAGTDQRGWPVSDETASMRAASPFSAKPTTVSPTMAGQESRSCHSALTVAPLALTRGRVASGPGPCDLETGGCGPSGAPEAASVRPRGDEPAADCPHAVNVRTIRAAITSTTASGYGVVDSSDIGWQYPAKRRPGALCASASQWRRLVSPTRPRKRETKTNRIEQRLAGKAINPGNKQREAP
jgi:hypothetical protein